MNAFCYPSAASRWRDAALGLRVAARPAHGAQRCLRRTRYWNSALCTPKTARGATAGTDGEARRSRWPIRLSGHRRRSRDSQSRRQRRARNRDAGIRRERRRNADRQADRCDHQRKSGRDGAGREFSTAPIRLPTPRNPRAMPSAAKPRTRPIANPATAPMAAVAPRAAPSRTIRFWRWSAIRDCARSSSRAARNWARPTGGETFRGKPMSDQEVTDVVAWLASHRVAESRGNHIPPRITRSTRSLTMSNETTTHPRADCS